MAFLPCDNCGSSTTHFWDTQIKILCEKCSPNNSCAIASSCLFRNTPMCDRCNDHNQYEDDYTKFKEMNRYETNTNQ